MDKVVWPTYVEQHRFLFKAHDVEGSIDEDVVRRLCIDVMPGQGDWNVEKMLVWIIDRVKEAIEKNGK